MHEKLIRFARKVPVLATFFVGVIYAINVLANFSKNTTEIINVAVAITGALAGLCFAMSATVDLKDMTKDRINYAGERFFHAAIFFLLATILKYAALSISSYDLLKGNGLLVALLTGPFHMFVVAMFMYAVLDAHSGIRVINDILWERLHRIKDWDKLD